MRGTIQIAKFANIPVLLHWSFGLIFVYVTYLSVSEGASWQATLVMNAFMLLLYICVILHEYGHALMARKYGVDTKDIIMFPIGGVARLERIPEKPMQEFFIAIAGPMVNVVIALLLLPIILFWQPFKDIILGNADILNISPMIIIPGLFVMNIVLVLFNMIPAFPMDGGRVLRSLLSLKLRRVRATQIAAILGQIVAVGFFCYGIYNAQYMTSLIGVFVFFAARNEYRMVKTEALLKTYTVRDILQIQYSKISIEGTMATPIAELKKGQEHNFLVFNENDKIVGVLHELFIAEAIKQNQHGAPIAEFTSRRFEFVSPDESLKNLLHKIQSKGYSILPVFEEGEVIGVVDNKGLEQILGKTILKT